MNRRRFLEYAALSGTLGCFGAAGCIPAARRKPAASVPAVDMEEVTIAGLQAAMNSGDLSAVAAVEHYLRRIETVDRSGITLRSIIELNPDAHAIAAALDEERRTRGARGPLHGVPIVLKDNIGTADRMTTTAGSLALEGSIPMRDSFVAERLRAAGAILLAKANMSEWANFRSSNSTSGWSARGGQCGNPYGAGMNPCGSSSGSGAAVSANLAAAAVGTETDGSIVCPSSKMGIVGIKPTVGLVSRSGIIPLADSQDTAGPMARTVADAALLLGALAAFDSRDPATIAAREHYPADYAAFLDPRGLQGARIGVARNFNRFDAEVWRLVEDAIAAMRAEGAIIIDPVAVPHLEDYADSEFEVLLYEFKAGLDAYLAGLGPAAPVRSLAEVIDFNERNREREMPYFGQDIFYRAEAKGPLTEAAYRAALARSRQLSREEGIDAVIQQHRLDAILAPAGGPAWLTNHETGDRSTGSSSRPAAVAGYPAITVPAGTIQGLPVGISLFGPAWSEPRLIALAYSFEQATHLRRRPPLP